MENYSESAKKNRQPILEKLLVHFRHVEAVVEIGSGSGQHAIFFTRQMPQLTWQATETAENLPALQKNLQSRNPLQLLPPLLLDVAADQWPIKTVENFFTANTLHIMPWPIVEKMFAGIGRTLRAGGLLCIYGAMRYNGAFTSESNARFDDWLKNKDGARGIRDFEAIDQLTSAQGLELLEDHCMPSNNQLLVWQKI